MSKTESTSLLNAEENLFANTTARFFRLATGVHQQGQINKRKAEGNNFLSADNASDVAMDISASLKVDIPSDQLDAIIQDLRSDFCEPAQKKIKIESPGP
ncbi:hypothetical protein [Rickettsiella endosymbiont of Dermanyssus gallinae]|uniref:hypothetical protein n=1 Tax=Rickettsiella endosymbiont of Dermanyssus gallinae TaxID=2856608 RepID=UPI001C52EC31|nr:hypothetical protein [Rickettsiella endosymbiont of Dermanyssus gallinae]